MDPKNPDQTPETINGKTFDERLDETAPDLDALADNVLGDQEVQDALNSDQDDAW